MKKIQKRKSVPLVIENHPTNYTGYKFITLLQYRKETHLLTIVDNAENNKIKAYVLDLCGPENVDERLVVEVADKWFNKHKDSYPLSVEFSKHGLTGMVCPIYRTFATEYISRVIGPLPTFNMLSVGKVRRRRKKRNIDHIPVTTNVVNLKR